jgi:hypothetical protein
MDCPFPNILFQLPLDLFGYFWRMGCRIRVEVMHTLQNDDLRVSRRVTADGDGPSRRVLAPPLLPRLPFSLFFPIPAIH